jgi:hypothetical protein
VTLLEYEEALKETDISVFVRENFGIDLPSIYAAEFEYMHTQLNQRLLSAYQMSQPSQASPDMLIVSPEILRQYEDLFKKENK